MTALPHISVSPDKRYLIKEDGTPFFYLADTAWELFHRTDREQAVMYLNVRAEQKFTAIQAVALAECSGLEEPNAYGRLPLIGRDPSRPAVTPGSDSANPGEYGYWDHVDFIIDEANRLGLYIALLPTWASWVAGSRRNPPGDIYFTVENAAAYGEFLGRRYRDKAIIWVLGGDRPGDEVMEVWRAMARGIAIGVCGCEDYEKVLMTYHPEGGTSSSRLMHDEPWLRFNMQQTGHRAIHVRNTWDMITADRERDPAKPVVDGEPLYEDHPIGFKDAAKNGFSFDAHVRQRLYWHLFAGACGITYGHHAVWQMHAPGRRPINGPLMYWYEAIHRPGAAQMRHVRALMESRPIPGRIPDQSLVVDALDGADRIQAARGDGYAFIYTACGRPFDVKMGKISGTEVKAHWYNPRNGAAVHIGTFANEGIQRFTPQFEGFGSDWVLVLDDADRYGVGPRYTLFCQ